MNHCPFCLLFVAGLLGMRAVATFDSEAVQAALDQAVITYQSGDTSNSVSGDLEFSVSQEEGVSLAWFSSAPLIIRTNGAVYRPGEADCFRRDTIPVVVTAVASKNGVSAARDFAVSVIPSADPDAPLYQGQWNSFWRSEPVIGEWLAGEQGLQEIPDEMKRNSFCYQASGHAEEVPFADWLNVVRLIGGWNKGVGSETPVPADVADLVYKDDSGALRYRWDKLALRLDPYMSRGYTNLTLVLDNIPYCFPASVVTQNYGQVACPADFSEWQTFVSNLCVELVNLYGYDTVDLFRFRQGTEAQSTDRFDGTQEEYFRIYDHSAAAVKSVLPDAKFGPFNAAGGINSNYNVRIADLARHCVSGTNAATGGIGAPFDFAPISCYLAQTNQATVPVTDRVSSVLDIFNAIQAELPEPVPFEIHEFGILTCASGLSTDEPGARGAEWTFQMIAGLRERGLSRWYHWGVFDTFRSRTKGLLSVLNSTGWIVLVLDRTTGGEAFTLRTSAAQNASTEIKAIGVFGGDRQWIVAGACNPNRLTHDPESVSIRVPLNLLATNASDRILWTSLSQTNSAHYLIRKDLEKAGMLNAAFSAVPEQLAAVRKMTTNATTSVEQDFLGESIDCYQKAVIDSLTLKPFPGTVQADHGEMVFTLTLTPPETAVICIGPDRTGNGVPYAWLDSYGLAANGYAAAEQGDADGDGYTAGQEYTAETNPENAQSFFVFTGNLLSTETGLNLLFNTVTGRDYSIYSSTNLIGGSWSLWKSNITGTGYPVSVDDPAANSSAFYRLKIGLPR